MLHGPEGRDGRQRQRDGGDQRGAHVAQEEEHDEHGERGAFEQRLHRGRVVAARVGDRVVDLGEADVGVLLAAARPACLSTTSATDSSLAPLERNTEKVTTGSPLRRANERCSLASSMTWPRSRQADLAAAGQARSWSRRAPRRVRAPASVRIACSWPPTSPRPPPRSTLVARTWRLTSAAVMPSASSRSGSSRTRISRSTPP